MPKLPILGKIFSRKKLENEPFLAIEISEEKRVKIAIWQSDNKKKYKILKTAIRKYEGEWEEVITEITSLILELIKERDWEEKIKKVIFGLPKNFVEKEKIKKPHLTNLKKLCQQLSLTPLGFVEIPQAITLLLKEKEGHLQTAILLKVGQSYFTFNVFKLGEEIGSRTVSYQDNLAISLSQALKEFSDLKTFPAKIILYDEEENLETIKQELLSYPWQKTAGFLQFPKIETLDEGFSLSALVAAGASQLVEEVSPVEASSQELGFLKEEDVAEKEALPLPEEETEEQEIEEKEPPRSFWEKMPVRPNFKRIAITLILLGIIVSGLLFYSYWLLPQARVKLFVEPYFLEKEAKITLNLSLQSLDESSFQLPGKEVVTEKRSSEKIAVSSKKEVGESAQGKVTIYNKTTNSKLFPKGTVITGPKDLKFTLDADVKVASLSDVIAGTPGKEKVKVTAVEIGPEGNFGAGSDFIFKDFPITSYAARNEEAFSGGTSREVTVVGKKDQEELFKLLKEQLMGSAKEELKEKLGPLEKLLDETIEEKILLKKFNYEVGEETDELTLDLGMSFKGIAFNEDDLNVLLKRMIEESTPTGYQFDKEKVEMETTSVKREKDEILFNAQFKVKLIPEIKTEDLKKKLVGKRLKEVEEYLRALANVSGFEIKFDSRPPLMKNTLPFNPQKIVIEILTL